MTEVVGRDRELQILDRFLDLVPTGPSAAILAGEPGIGKTTLWKAATSRASARGYRILAAAPAEAEARFPYAVLGDLLASVQPGDFAALPLPQRRALDAALLRGDTAAPPAAQRAVATGVLTLLTSLSAEGPLILAIDDEQWVDSPSSAVLRFAIRRIEAEPVSLILAHRSQQHGQLVHDIQRRLAPDRLRPLEIRPLAIAALDDLLLSRLGRPLSRSTLERIYAISGGNPFFALEIGRILVDDGGHLSPADEIPIPENLKELVRGRINRLPPETRRLLLAVAALSQPTIDLVTRATQSAPSALQRAVADDILEVHGFRLRFTHPLLASVVYGDASTHQRQTLHRRLAEVVPDAEERARHLAFGATGPDANVADALDGAARTANRRGAPDAAAALAERAAELTPADRLDDICRRVIDAADYHLLSGDTARAQALLQRLAAPETPAAWRAPALERRAKTEFYDGNLGTAESVCREALDAAADDPRFIATLERDLVHILHQRGKLDEAVPHSRALLGLGESLHDPAIVTQGRSLIAFSEMLLGFGLPPEVRALAMQFADSVGPGRSERNASVLDPALDSGVMLKWADDFASARTVFKAVLRRAADDREESGRAPILFHLCELEIWAGDWLLAAVYAEECRKAVLHSGQGAFRRLPLTASGYLEACLGHTEKARAAANDALAQSRQVGDAPYVLRNLRTLGFLELSLGNAPAALRYFDPLRESALDNLQGEPGILRYQADRIEALILAGRLGEAEQQTAWLDERGRTLQRTWAVATALRCGALLKSVRGDLGEALALLDAALLAYEGLEQPLERARTLLVKGSVERRAKQKRLARESLSSALASFEGLGAPLWAARARQELDRVSGPAPEGQALTATEARVANLVAAGRTNREVGQELYMTVKTVEANLSRIYAKMTVRSRSELTAKLAGRTAAGPD